MEARIHQWFDERCVEPRVQQIILPNLWPRKKNTRGGEEDEDEGGSGGEDMVDELVERANGKGDVRDVSNSDSLEARMAAEGRKLREDELKQEKVQRSKDSQSNPALRRRPGHKSLASVESFRMPGRFE